MSRLSSVVSRPVQLVKAFPKTSIAACGVLFVVGTVFSRTSQREEDPGVTKSLLRPKFLSSFVSWNGLSIKQYNSRLLANFKEYYGISDDVLPNTESHWFNTQAHFYAYAALVERHGLSAKEAIDSIKQLHDHFTARTFVGWAYRSRKDELERALKVFDLTDSIDEIAGLNAHQLKLLAMGDIQTSGRFTIEQVKRIKNPTAEAVQFASSLCQLGFVPPDYVAFTNEAMKRDEIGIDRDKGLVAMSKNLDVMLAAIKLEWRYTDMSGDLRKRFTDNVVQHYKIAGGRYLKGMTRTPRIPVSELGRIPLFDVEMTLLKILFPEGLPSFKSTQERQEAWQPFFEIRACQTSANGGSEAVLTVIVKPGKDLGDAQQRYQQVLKSFITSDRERSLVENHVTYGGRLPSVAFRDFYPFTVDVIDPRYAEKYMAEEAQFNEAYMKLGPDEQEFYRVNRKRLGAQLPPMQGYNPDVSTYHGEMEDSLRVLEAYQGLKQEVLAGKPLAGGSYSHPRPSVPNFTAFSCGKGDSDTKFVSTAKP